MITDVAVPMLPSWVEVSNVGETVLWRIGNADPFCFHFEQALLLSAWLREEGGAVREEQGFGKLNRALAMPDAPDPAPRPAFGVHVKPKLIALHRSDVFHMVGSVSVFVKLPKGMTAELPAGVALTMSQFIRVNAKACQRRAGDARHWSEATDQAAVKAS